MTMKVLERYAAAVNSDNLAVDARTTWADSDVLGAAGLAARYEPLGVALVRLFADGKPEQAVAILTDMAFKRARTVKVKLSQVQAGDLSRAVLGWYRHGTCQPCGGTGFQMIPGTPMQGDECPHCKGTGRLLFDRQFPGEALELARWLSGEIDRAQVAAGRAAMAMLAPTLTL
jgi:hypothetical protein